MKGLPLNWQLTDLGATFARKAQTSTDYTLYALTGCQPARPGLLRTNGPEGREIALEVWSLPKRAFATLITLIPAPLVIGSIELSNGSFVKGFLCETSGINGAKDITNFGDWRLFLAQKRL